MIFVLRDITLKNQLLIVPYAPTTAPPAIILEMENASPAIVQISEILILKIKDASQYLAIMTLD